jgi:ectoine hydroxylase-related dioxygenase (phytanoyl-CoA dioxygenase family)
MIFRPNTRSRAANALRDFRAKRVAVVLRLLSQDGVAVLVAESERLWRVAESRGASDPRNGIRVQPSGEVRVDRLDPVADSSDEFAALNADPDVVSLAEAALGSPVVVMKEKLIYKRPGTIGFGLHRDADYNTARTGIPGGEMFSVCVALDAVTRATGPIELFPDLRDALTPRLADEPRDIDTSAIEGHASLLPELQPGDALIFDALVPHRSAPNRSNRLRRMYTMTFVPACYSHAREAYYASRVTEESRERERLLASKL